MLIVVRDLLYSNVVLTTCDHLWTWCRQYMHIDKSRTLPPAAPGTSDEFRVSLACPNFHRVIACTHVLGLRHVGFPVRVKQQCPAFLATWCAKYVVRCHRSSLHVFLTAVSGFVQLEHRALGGRCFPSCRGAVRLPPCCPVR